MSDITDQIVWSFFFNAPIHADEIKELLIDVKIFHKEYRTPVSTNTWHTIQLDKYSEVNKLKTILMLEKYNVKQVKVNSGRSYFNVYARGEDQHE